MKDAAEIEEDERRGGVVPVCDVPSLFTRRWALTLLCVYVTLQSCVVTGLFAATISSVQQQYNFKSITVASLANVYDAGIISLVVPVSYYGARNRPRALGIGCMMLATGALLFAAPSFFSAYTGL
jgi:hypothetical protein